MNSKFLLVACILLLAGVATANLLGGYTPQPTEDNDVQRALNFAIRAIVEEGHPHKFVSIDEAYTQVVNGINYRLVCTFRTPHNVAQHEIIVYEPFGGEHTLTSFKPV